MSSQPTRDRSLQQRLKSYFTTGAVLVIPALLTVGIAVFIFGFLSGYIEPVAVWLGGLVGLDGAAADLLTLGVALGLVVLLGAAVETLPHGPRAADYFHRAVEAIPGVGNVYGGFREMSETVADGEDSFRDVKLVEYPTEGSYTMAFVTSDAPTYLEESVGHDEEGMMSLFLPMGPNPVMGGFVIYVSRDRVHDIDIGVDEGLQAIITSGVTISEDEDDPEIGERMRQRLDTA